MVVDLVQRGSRGQDLDRLERREPVPIGTRRDRELCAARRRATRHADHPGRPRCEGAGILDDAGAVVDVVLVVEPEAPSAATAASHVGEGDRVAPRHEQVDDPLVVGRRRGGVRRELHHHRETGRRLMPVERLRKPRLRVEGDAIGGRHDADLRRVCCWRLDAEPRAPSGAEAPSGPLRPARSTPARAAAHRVRPPARSRRPPDLACSTHGASRGGP